MAAAQRRDDEIWFYGLGRQYHVLSCGDLVVRAEAAAHQRVVVILEQKSGFDGPLHRVPSGGLDKKRRAH